MTAWSGHHRRTSAALLGLLAGAAAGRNDFTLGERAFVMACEFWAAAMNRTLAQHLGRDASARLRSAERAFSALGAPSVATVLRLGQLELEKAEAHARSQQLAAMEATLARIDEPVDDLIAQYAAELASEHPRRPARKK